MEEEQMEGLLQRCSYWVGYLFRNLCSLLFYFYSGTGRLGKGKGVEGDAGITSMTGSLSVAFQVDVTTFDGH
jgi:hypothetical protein